MGLDPITIVYLVIAGLSVASGVMSAQAARKAKRLAEQSVNRARGFLYQVRATAQPRRLIFGTTRVGALETYVASSGADNTFLNYIFIWGEGPCKGVPSLMFNGELVEFVTDPDDATVKIPAPGSPYAGHVRWQTNLGKPGEVALGNGEIPGWGATDRLDGICASWVQFKFSETVWPKGLPDVSGIVQGIDAIKDARLLDSDLDTSATPTNYSENPALQLNYFMQLVKLGPGLADDEIGEDELYGAANVCDELVNLQSEDSSNDVGSERRYTFNGAVILDGETEEIIQRFLTAMAGWRVYVGGKWRIYAGAPQTPTFTITDDMIVSPFVRSFNTSRMDRFNIVRGVYASELTKWQPTDFPAYRNQSFIDADGDELPEDLELLDSGTPSRCRRIAKINCLRSRLEVIQLVCTIEAYRAQAGLPVYLHSPANGFVNVHMDVEQLDLVIDGREVKVVLNLRGAGTDAPNSGPGADGVYDWDEESTDGDFDHPEPPTVLPPIPLPNGGTQVDGGEFYANLFEDGDTEAVVPSGIECATKAGEKCMPDLPSFGGGDEDPLAPRYFAKFERKTAAPFLHCNFVTSDCSIPFSACPGGISGSYTGTMPGIPFQIVFSFSVVKISEVPGVSGTFAFGGHCTVDDNSPNPPTVYGVRILCDQGGAGSSHNPGDVVTFPIGTVVGLNPQFFRGGFNTPPGMPPAPGCVDPGVPMVSVVQDVWDLTNEWSFVTNSMVQTDLSGRNSYDVPGSCSPGTPPGEGTMPPGDPVSLYGGGITVTNNSPVTKTYDGIGCNGAGQSWSGAITDSLSNEIHPEDMIAIALGVDSILDVPDGELDSPLFECGRADACCTAFILREAPDYRCVLFRAVKCRGYIEARFVTEGDDYIIRIHYYRRPVASGTFTEFAHEDIFVSDATHDQAVHGIFTDWKEVPNVDGFETRAGVTAVHVAET